MNKKKFTPSESRYDFLHYILLQEYLKRAGFTYSFNSEPVMTGSGLNSYLLHKCSLYFSDLSIGEPLMESESRKSPEEAFRLFKEKLFGEELKIDYLPSPIRFVVEEDGKNIRLNYHQPAFE